MNATRLMAFTFAAAMLVTGTSFAADDAPHWEYKGDSGPANWGDLHESFAACKNGKMQSPIDLASANTRTKVSVKVSYKPTPLTVLNNGHTVQFNVNNGSSISLGGKTFKLLQFHFHTPSEHVMHGKPLPLEAHFVHKSADGALAVIGVVFAEWSNNQILKPLMKHIPMEKTKPVHQADVMIDLAAMLPANRQLFRYMGSLTTPPCSEGVNWMVMKTPVFASKEQIAALNKAMGDNARPKQPANNRLIIAPK